MSKLKIQGFVCTSILFAAVAVFSSVATLGASKAGTLNLSPASSNPTVIRSADGGQPYPQPPVTADGGQPYPQPPAAAVYISA